MNLSNILTYFTTSWGYVTVQGDSLITPVGCNRGIRRNCGRPFGLLTDSLSCAKKKKKTKTHTTIFLTSYVNVHKTFKNYKLSLLAFQKLFCKELKTTSLLKLTNVIIYGCKRRLAHVGAGTPEENLTSALTLLQDCTSPQ